MAAADKRLQKIGWRFAKKNYRIAKKGNP